MPLLSSHFSFGPNFNFATDNLFSSQDSTAPISPGSSKFMTTEDSLILLTEDGKGLTTES